MNIISKYNLNKFNWTYKGFHGVLHTFFPVGENPIKPLKKNYGDAFKITLFFVENNYVHWYWNNKDMERLRKSVIRRVNEDNKFLVTLVKKWCKKVKKFERIYRTINPQLLAKLNDREIMRLYQRFYEAYIDEYSIAIGLQDPFSMQADLFLDPIFRKVIKENFNNILTALMSPVKESFINKELKQRYALLKEARQTHTLKKVFLKLSDKKLLFKIEEKFPAFYRKIAEHSSSYHWLQNNYAKVIYLDESFFITQIKELLHNKIDPHKKISEMESHSKKIKKNKINLIKEFKLGKELKNLIKITEVFAYMQDERKKYVLISNYYQNLFRNEIGKRLGLTSDEMNYTIFPELYEMLMLRKVNRKTLEDRRKFCLCIWTPSGYQVVSGKTAKNAYVEIFDVSKKKSDVIKGQIASSGLARGSVKIIKKTHDLINMRKGDILVASMTRPEMITAIKKAAAIITDEGGITCHAAIVSREMNIPCIIGTKIATKVLKDGDFIEVDADRGVVKILKRQ